MKNTKDTSQVPQGPKESSFAIDAVPALLRKHGLTEAHSRPLAGWYDHGKRGIRSRRATPSTAFDFQYVELRSAWAYTSIILDCDDVGKLEEGLCRIGAREMPEYNWAVTNPYNGHGHLVWTLRKPVLRFPEARIRPLLYYRHILEYFRFVFGADPGYVGVLTKNPTWDSTEYHYPIWGRKRNYTLDDLAWYIPEGWRKPELSETGLGRNVDLFQSLMRWAGREANSASSIAHQAALLNKEFSCPLPLSEVRATVKSVEGYRRRWIRRGWDTPRWIQRQRARGIASGKARRKKVEARNEVVLGLSQHGLRQTEIAERTGISRQTVGDIEHQAAAVRATSRAQRNAAITNWLRKGWSPKQVALAAGVSLRTVYRVRDRGG